MGLWTPLLPGQAPAVGCPRPPQVGGHTMGIELLIRVRVCHPHAWHVVRARPVPTGLSLVQKGWSRPLSPTPCVMGNQGPERGSEVLGPASRAGLKPRLPPPARPALPHVPDTWLLSWSHQRTTYFFRTPGQVLSGDGLQSTDTESGLSIFTDMCWGLPTSEAATRAIATVNCKSASQALPAQHCPGNLALELLALPLKCYHPRSLSLLSLLIYKMGNGSQGVLRVD